MPYLDAWLWLIFVVVGLLLALSELIIGVQTGFDLVVIGSAFILGGLATWPLHSWPLTVIVTSVICVAYVALGRKYVHRWTQVSRARTNVDTIIGRNGIVLQSMARNKDGLVRVGNEEWRARSEEEINEGDEVIVSGLTGVTLIVSKSKGGS
ncbi:MAG: NfeD family protein [Chloroflexi bacterium]|nr:NfeD family protein [Chloroflexota bacterium]